MGMFDSFVLNVKCPICGNVADVEFQTKAFECALKEWHQGKEFITDNGIEIYQGIIRNVYGGCKVENNPICGMQWEKKNRPHCIGFGYPLICDVVITNGIVDRAVNVRVYHD